MKIIAVVPKDKFLLHVVSNDGRNGMFNVEPYLEAEAFEPLRDLNEFKSVRSGGYFVEWDCGADLSADTIEAHWKPVSMTGLNPLNQVAAPVEAV